MHPAKFDGRPLICENFIGVSSLTPCNMYTDIVVIYLSEKYMCRFIAYIGNPLVLDEVLYKPKHSLIKQSYQANEGEETLNGDGFGLGWYAHEISGVPAVFRSIQPAWNDMNLKYLAEKLRSNCFLAHVRSASHGDVTLDNCHPFHYKQFLYMHNGDIGDFALIKRDMHHTLSDELYNWVKGQTDSELFFALFLQHFLQKDMHFDITIAAKILITTIQQVEKLKHKYHGKENTYISAVISSGKNMLGVRYVSDPAEVAPSLYYATGSHYEYHDGTCHIHPITTDDTGAVLIVSEPLTDYRAEWQEVPNNHILLVYGDLKTELVKI